MGCSDAGPVAGTDPRQAHQLSRLLPIRGRMSRICKSCHTFQINQTDATGAVIVYLSISTSGAPDAQAFEQAVADLINEQRQISGLPPLRLAPELTQSARRHAQDMATHGFIGHTGSDGSSPGQRIQEAGYNWLICGEVVGKGTSADVEALVSAWMNSPTHRPILLAASFEDFGVGYAQSSGDWWRHYWAVDFGKRAS